MIKLTLPVSFAAFACMLLSYSASAQFAFTDANASAGITPAHSGNAVSVVDVNNDGLDDIVKMDQSSNLHIELQQQDGSFNFYDLGDITGGSNVWGMACADVDHNGWKDVATGVNGTMYLVKLFWSGSTITKTQTTLAGSYFVQSITFADFNNDGWSDLYVCDDNNYSKIYMNSSGTLRLLGISQNSMTIGTGSKSFNVQTGLAFTVGQIVKVGYNGNNYMTGSVTAYNTGTGAMTVLVTAVTGSGTFNSWSVDPNIIFNSAHNTPTTYSGDPADSGNYGSVWTDFDNDGDLDFFVPHCRQSASSSTDLRRKDRLFVNDGNNLFTESAATYGIEVSNFKQTWTASFGDIDNDGDFDLLTTNHGATGEIFENNGSGMYTLIPASGYTTSINPIESVLADFDNDGYLDILLTEQTNLFWKNNGDKTFTVVPSVLPNLTGMLSFATGDLNHDGFIDLYTSYGNVYNTPTTTDDVLYLNNKNSNHFIVFNLTGTTSNHDAIGAKVTITGSFGTQVREVRAGESYGTANSMQCHFGLGSATTITSATIEWPAGGTTSFGALDADQFVTVVEGGCSITGNTIPGPYNMCTGGSLTLNAAAGFDSYLWNTGASTSSITTSTGGDFNVMVTSGACSNISPTVSSVMNPDETPTISSTGSNNCEGVITLTSSPAASYSWSGPGGFTATTQTIYPTTSGNYTVLINGLCANFTSAPFNVTVNPATAPTGTGAMGPGPASFTLTASGTGGSLKWWDMPTGGTMVGTGTTYNTPVISVTTTYYVDDEFTYPGPSASTSNDYHQGTNLFSGTGTNGSVDFDVLAACTLKTVKVYTDTPGNREVVLQNSGGATINSLLYNFIADTNIVTLNFPLTPGSNYHLTTNATVNNATLGTTSPRLMRSNQGVSYPYTTAGFVSLTGSNQGSTVYYYYYDWQLEKPSETCISPRTPVTATVSGTTGIAGTSASNGIRVYPNPASSQLNILFEGAVEGRTIITLTDVTGRVVRTSAVENATAGQTLNMDVNDLAGGSYMIRIQSNEKNTIQKLMLTK